MVVIVFSKCLSNVDNVDTKLTVKLVQFVNVDMIFTSTFWQIVNRIGKRLANDGQTFIENIANFAIFLVRSGAKRRKSCRSRNMMRKNITINLHELASL